MGSTKIERRLSGWQAPAYSRYPKPVEFNWRAITAQPVRTVLLTIPNISVFTACAQGVARTVDGGKIIKSHQRALNRKDQVRRQIHFEKHD